MSDSLASNASGLKGPVHLAVDLGASSGRVIAGAADGGKIQLAEVWRFENKPVRMQADLLWNHLGLWQDITHGLRLAADQVDASPLGEIASVGVDTWGVDFGFIDDKNQLISPVRCYRDPRNLGRMQDALKRVSREEIFAETGLQFMEINTLYQLLAAQQAGDVGYQHATSLLMMADLFHWMLSGERTIEATNASTTQLLSPVTGKWSEKLLGAFDFPSHWFPTPTQAGTTIGEVQCSVATMTGLHGVSVIAPATHDTASAVLSVPAEEFAPAKPDWCYISSGTWSLMGVELPEPKVTKLCAELNFTNEGGVHGSTRLLKNIGGLWIFQQIRAALQRRGSAPSWAEMVEAAEQAEPFSLIINPDDPSLLAPADMIDEICSLAGRTNQRVPMDDGVLFRGALEGLALRYRLTLESLERLTESSIKTIHIVGGGSLNALLCQMTADACNRTVVAGPVEATAIGNVAMQMIGSGRLHSIVEARDLVRKSFPTKTYSPGNSRVWDEPAARFAEL
ncbi:rhamnulokinase [Aporhodopirellula aestuarii]|uniref:Rhamnulokinase n=1 Tax=Aporhodopirellula aestuarii TaxID=2950107 RepID=A0ABT0U0M0_9BACT|nr:rhamnulokinase family protein [Aporhodopirellula aestuarii]MCM2370424.1 rhamnulokinase [Aporhodopirellula aestuarii]